MTVALIVFSILQPLEDAVRWLLDRFHYNLGLPWAWAIVATTIVVRIALVPLTVRQIHSMQSLQKHAPEMKELQKKYKGDRAKLNEEMMRFYKENHINPAASCLPLVAQFPVFISLYLVLKHFSSHIPPGSDLSWLHIVPNITDKASSHWSGYLLLAVYAVSQVLSTYFMSADDGEVAADPDDGPAADLHQLHRALPDRARDLLGDDEPVDGRPGHRHPAARAANAARPADDRRPEDGRRGRRRRGSGRRGKGDAGNGARTEPPPQPKPRPPPRRSRAVSSGRRAAPGGDRASSRSRRPARRSARRNGGRCASSSSSRRRSTRTAVRFQVLSEGERGLLGVGYEPARVLATAAAAPRARGGCSVGGRERGCRPPPRAARARDRGDGRPLPDRRRRDGDAARRNLRRRRPRAADRQARRRRSTPSRRSRTRSSDGGEQERKEIVVDAAGYRDRRRRTLEALALRSAEEALRDGRAGRARADERRPSGSSCTSG